LDSLVERPTPPQWPAGHRGPAHPAGDRLSGELLADQRAGRAELLAELPEADQRHLLQALESLPAVLARHPNASRLVLASPRRRPRTTTRSRAKLPAAVSAATVRLACG